MPKSGCHIKSCSNLNLTAPWLVFAWCSDLCGRCKICGLANCHNTCDLWLFVLPSPHPEMRKQQNLFSKPRTEHGGSLPNPQKTKRPLGRKFGMHLVLRSSHAHGPWNFRRYKDEIDQSLNKFANKHHILILKCANVGNHIHLYIKISSRKAYRSFIRAITSSIRSIVTGFSRWRPAPEKFRFWNQRPFSRVIQSHKEKKVLLRYIVYNILESLGVPRKDRKSLYFKLFHPIQNTT